MTVSAPDRPARTSPVPPAISARLRRRWTRARWIVAVGLVVVVAAFVVALSTFRGSVMPNDPENSGQNGTRALAEILRRQGVEVVKVTRSTQLESEVNAATTLVVVNPFVLGPDQLDRVADARPGGTVLVAPDAVTLDHVAPDVTAAGIHATRNLRPGDDCGDPDATAAGEATAGSHVYRATGPTAEVCYPDPSDRDAGSYVAARDDDGRPVRIIGQERVLQNRYLADEGNAALAIRAIGQTSRVVWYVPDPLELSDAGEPPTLLGLVPAWFKAVLVQLVLVVVVVLLWRSRRLGRLVPEPLPVVVRAAETEEGRARLYRQAGARGRAAATLRTATLRRLASRLAVPAGTTPEHVTTLVADAVGRPGPEVHAVLLGPAPADDGALVTLADELDRIERQVADGPAGRTQQP